MPGDSAPNLRTYEWKPRYSSEDEHPLTAFYIPALSRSVQYDRKAGFFSSTALAIAAAGLNQLIRNGGRMRLLVGCRLSARDVEAVRRGYSLRARVEERLSEDFGVPDDELRAKRWQFLEWLVAKARLEIKVAVPVDDMGLPLNLEEAEGIFHEKVGIFTDSQGNRLVFNGSINESESAWLKNRESFHVFRSWAAEEARHVAAEVEEFERLWVQKARRTAVFEFPEALRRRLIQLAPEQPPDRDPVEDLLEPPLEALKERWLFQFVRDAPYLVGVAPVGEATAPIRPWPHQFQIVRRAVERFPERFLFCDEVGLGKTIEAGLALRELLLSGEVSRCLILVPRSILKQWQEELWEKFGLNVMRYEGSHFEDAFGTVHAVRGENPWDEHDLTLASSHLAKRSARQPEVLAARDWDLVIVDEAHHARRRSPADSTEYRPNNLLRLLLKLAEKTRGLWLLTATPMQLDPIELWDLLNFVGLYGHWGAARGEYFRRFFEELRKFPEGDARLALRMAAEYLKAGGELDRRLEEHVRSTVGWAAWKRLLDAVRSNGQRVELARLSPQEQAACVQFLRKHTPIRRSMFRATRPLLKQYREKGILKESVPDRDVEDVFIEMEPEEERLYHQVEEYISEYWRRAEERADRALGFVMVIYRRRLTSSPYALQESLRRRLDFLKGEAVPDQPGGLTGEDLEDEDLDDDIREELEERGLPEDVEQEVQFIESFLQDIQFLGQDSKFKRLADDLHGLLQRHRKILVFSQYTDTMDFLRRELVTVYGRQVGCFSGRGGEVWDADAREWRTVSKKEIQERFKADDDVNLLLCTDAASEGLNLQTCGVLINYDMPWNPMRAEQRIGRIDRIGQKYARILVRNYFYDGTVEAEIWRRLKDRIHWFQWVVGNLQPILGRIPKIIRSAAVGADGGARLEEEIRRLESELDRREYAELNIDDYVEQEVQAPRTELAPVGLDDLERLFLESEEVRRRVRFRDVGDGVYEVVAADRTSRVTFTRDSAGGGWTEVELLTYGSPTFATLLRMVPPPPLEGQQALPLLRVAEGTEGRLSVGYFWVEGGQTREVRSLKELRQLLDQPLKARELVVPEAEAKQLRAEVRRRSEEEAGRVASAVRARLEARAARIRVEAQRLLGELLAVEVARTALPATTRGAAPMADWRAVLRTKLEARELPYPALLEVVRKSPADLEFRDDDMGKYIGESTEALNATLGQRRREAEAMLREYREVLEELTERT